MIKNQFNINDVVKLKRFDEVYELFGIDIWD